MTAIDLYSGIGGWTLGLRASGIEVLRSYEWWSKANATHGLNHGHTPEDINIRELNLEGDLPTPGSVDFVVGSPPCTQFSFANRGGNGDLEDGLVDIRQFLRVVQYLRPRCWAMENVPRVSGILEKELAPGGKLEEFAELFTANLVVDAAEFGLPQGRKRMIAGRFDKELLLSYRARTSAKTLGDVLGALEGTTATDPNWGFSVSLEDVTDHLFEEPLSAQEARMNREAKTHHPVYNRMAFPDSLSRPARTVTATCTRVSRESIVVACPDGFRRLTIRERALLQGFPITLQFAGGSYNDRAKMIGNAVPPVLTYYIAQAMLQTPAAELVPLEQRGVRHQASRRGKSAQPESPGRTYPIKRSFRFAIPGLRFHSGVRFELRNLHKDGATKWRIDFYYGNSKRIVEGNLSHSRIEAGLHAFGYCSLLEYVEELFRRHAHAFASVDGSELQARWTAHSTGPGPFDLIDNLALVASGLVEQIRTQQHDQGIACAKFLFPDFNVSKLEKHWREVIAGAAMAAALNQLWDTGESLYVASTGVGGQMLFAIDNEAKKKGMVPASLLVTA